VDATVTPPTEAETAWITAQLAAAQQFLDDYGSARVGHGLDALDHAWASWLDRESVDPADPNAVINAVGVYLGQAIVDAMPDFVWVIATDEDGTDLAVHGLPNTADVLVYPANLVAKRYESRTATFLRAVFDEIVATAARLRG
jgi:Domain of unknown function (DUF3806)